jgi:hypothetical protein
MSEGVGRVTIQLMRRNTLSTVKDQQECFPFELTKSAPFWRFQWQICKMKVGNFSHQPTIKQYALRFCSFRAEKTSISTNLTIFITLALEIMTWTSIRNSTIESCTLSDIEKRCINSAQFDLWNIWINLTTNLYFFKIYQFIVSKIIRSFIFLDLISFDKHIWCCLQF